MKNMDAAKSLAQKLQRVLDGTSESETNAEFWAEQRGNLLAKREAQLARAYEWVAGDLDLNEMNRDEAIASFAASIEAVGHE